MKREFEATRSRFDLTGLLDVIRDNRIKKIIASNYFLCERYIESALYLPGVLQFLGVELIGIDYDPIEYYPIAGPAERQLFHNDGFNRFTCLPFLHKYWDEKQGNRNVHYTAVVRHYPAVADKITLADDYSLLVLSNSRYEAVRRNLKMLLSIVEELDGKSFIADLQMWYLAARHIVLEKLTLTDYARSEFCKVLMNAMYAASQLLKYEVIESIESNRKIEIYGDEGWGRLFPQYYRNRYLNPQEIDAFNGRDDVLYLLLNNNYGYLEASGTVYDCVCKNKAFINFPAAFKTNDLTGLSHVEYDDKRRLNELIENAAKIYRHAELQDSIEKLRDLYIESENSVVDLIRSPAGTAYRRGKFDRQIEEHGAMMEEAVQDYVAKNAGRIMRTLDNLYDPAFRFDIRRSRYADRRYVKVLSEEA
jgi:hypothetical protein